MMAIIEDTSSTVFVNSLSDIFRALNVFEPKIESACRNEDHKFLVWFRGQTKSQHYLIPSLYRKYDFDGKYNKRGFWKVIQDKEKYYINDFRIRNYHLISPEPGDELTLMSTMQHYGTPTRLLDWSENIFAALFFALEDYFSSERKNEKVLPCIWCLKPLVLNRLAIQNYHLGIQAENLPDMLSVHSQFRSNRGVLNSNNLENYFFHQKGKPDPFVPECWPLAIIPPRNNARIYAQSGTFTLFPIRTNQIVDDLKAVSLDNLPTSHTFLRQFILIKPAYISFELRAAGVKRSMFYPEMASFSYDIEQELNLNLR